MSGASDHPPCVPVPSAPDDKVTLWREIWPDGRPDSDGWASVPPLYCEGFTIESAEFVRVGVERAATVKEIVAALDALGADQDAEPPWDGWISAARFIESRFGGAA